MPSGPLQFGTSYNTRRVVVAAGNFSILDFFDKNAFGIDPRQGFFSLGFLTYAAYDFASDARGYSWGGVTELYWDNWAAPASAVWRRPKIPINCLSISSLASTLAINWSWSINTAWRGRRGRSAC